MLNNDSPSIPLDAAEQAKIGLVQNRLTVLQAEVLNATKELAAIEESIAQGQKNKEYYFSLVEALQPKIDSLGKRSEELTAQVQESENLLRQHHAEQEKLDAHYSLKENEHAVREDTIRAANADLVKRTTELNVFERLLETREQKIEKAEAAFRTALESLK